MQDLKIGASTEFTWIYPPLGPQIQHIYEIVGFGVDVKRIIHTLH